jgi:hypothetical protein
MAVSSITPVFPTAGITLPDPGILRPNLTVLWAGGTGPYDTQFQIDDDPAFGSPLIDVTTLSVTSPHSITPGSDLGLPGPWHWRVRVRDQADGVWSAWSVGRQINYFDPKTSDRYLYLLAKNSVSFDPQDAPAGGWGPAPAAVGADGLNIAFERYLYLLAKLGVGFDPIDTPAGGWDPEGIGSVLIGPGDGFALEFDRYLYLLANVDTSTPTPHIWYVFPTFGREGWEFRIVGYGFGDSQATYSGSATLDGVALSILAWELIAETGTDLAIDPLADLAEPEHQQIRTSVPIGGTSGLVIVCTDGP